MYESLQEYVFQRTGREPDVRSVVVIRTKEPLRAGYISDNVLVPPPIAGVKMWATGGLGPQMLDHRISSVPPESARHRHI